MSPRHHDHPVATAPSALTTPTNTRRRARQHLLRWTVGLVLGTMQLMVAGCAALTNPVADGVPVHRVPDELLGESKNDRETIPLTWLRREPTDKFLLAPGDTIGVWVEGVLGDRNANPPIYIPGRFSFTGRNEPPAVGFPFLVREDGTISLPLIDPIDVRGMTLRQAEDAIRNAYTVDNKILLPGRERIIVSLMLPRTHRVWVIRQETGGFTVGTEGTVAVSNKFASGHVIDLPAYDNDVLTAVGQSGGLPGLDAFNEIVVFKGVLNKGGNGKAIMHELEQLPPGGCDYWAEQMGVRIIRIPLRMVPGTPPPFSPEDVILETGDVVFIEARNEEGVFYTGGLLPPGQYSLPRDFDLDVIQAVSFVNGPLVNGGFNVDNLNGALIAPRIGGPSPSLLVILRKTEGGAHIPIRVDLNRAMRDPRERILIQPDDVLILQETIGEAVARYVTQTVFLDFLGFFVNRQDAQGTVNVSTP
ncbi:Polysaccharide biosynthesis/export protein [Planctomycetes bacterium Pan216]|uniref:Polysaccharide biosynthesis/export protein n=1 Tax=Kolteria novifilia TaxID=2527975 RepID=A0A518B6K4_9BACT|nr:Polysaccharide biosynthesis/export protein [Planctomycetes bacterium Pan216]